MTKMTRSEFLGRSAALAAALGTGGLTGCLARAGQAEAAGRNAGSAPDLVLHNARIHTVDPQLPRAQAFAVRDGRFLAVGSDDEILPLIGGATTVIDGAGMTVTPGFIDCHSHPAGAGLSALTSVDAGVASIAELKDAMRRKARETPAGQWVSAVMYDDTKMREGRPITRWDLDEAVPDQPARVGHRSGHASYYNSRALELAGVPPDVADPPGGRFGRDAAGRLDGMATGSAREAFARVAQEAPATRADWQAGVKLIFERMAASGLTSVHDAGTGAAALAAYHDAYEAGELSVRVHCLVRGPYRNLVQAGVRSGFGDAWLSIGPVKFTADGAVASRTMYMSEPYVGRPADHGILYMTPDEILAAVRDAHANRFRVAIHANGDVPITYVLDAYERVLQDSPRSDHRFRIEHCSLVTPEILRRIKALGVIPAPFYTYVYWHGDKFEEYGAERLERMFAHRSFLEHGIPVAPASDFGPGPYEPMMAIQSMVTRTDFQGKRWGASQRITVDEALRICTLNGAYASFEENVKGSITPGKYADFVILGADPHEVDPMRIKDIPIVRTVVDGRTTYEA